MSTPVHAAPLVRVSGEQLSLSSTVASLGVPPGAGAVRIRVPNTDFRFHLNPAIKAVWYYDASATAGSRFSDLRANLVDRATGTGTGSTMNSLQTGDRLYVAVSNICGGLRVTIGNANGNDSALSGAYSKNDATFAALSITDGTISPAGKSLGATGSVTWTVPTDFARLSLADLGLTDTDTPSGSEIWLRFAWDGAMDSTTSITELWTLNKDTNRAYWYADTILPISFDMGEVGAIEAILTAGTDTADVNWLIHRGV